MNTALKEACNDAPLCTLRDPRHERYGSQILAYLIKAGEVSKIDCALDHGPDPNNANKTTLSVVLGTKLGNFDIVNQLRERGGVISARNHTYITSTPSSLHLQLETRCSFIECVSVK